MGEIDRNYDGNFPLTNASLELFDKNGAWLGVYSLTPANQYPGTDLEQSIPATATTDVKSAAIKWTDSESNLVGPETIPVE